MMRKLFAVSVAASVWIVGCANDSGGNCVVNGDGGCLCGVTPFPDDVPFERTCDESAFGGRPTVCCREDDVCACEPVQCGSEADGTCICGVGIITERRIVASCDGTASTCCTQDTGYCYCEEGCERRFGSRVVLSCNQTTDTARCSTGQTQVASCE